MSTDHRTVSIQNMLDYFNASVGTLNNGRRAVPSYVVVDFSYALIHASIKSFNECNLLTYLKTCERILCSRATHEEIQDICYVVLCSAHMIKSVIRRLHKVQPNANFRQIITVWFVGLQRATTLHTAVSMYTDIHSCLCSEHETDDVKTATKRLQARCQNDRIIVEQLVRKISFYYDSSPNPSLFSHLLHFFK